MNYFMDSQHCVKVISKVFERYAIIKTCNLNLSCGTSHRLVSKSIAMLNRPDKDIEPVVGYV